MIHFLIPTYNDSQNIEAILINIKKNLGGKSFGVLIVDDGSKDQLSEVVKNLSKKYPLRRIGYKKNKGPGYAFKFGFDYLIPKSSNKDIIVTMEGDNTTDYKILNKMIKKSQDFDVVLASVFIKGGNLKGMNMERKILSFVASVLDSLIFRIKGVKTYSSFYRVYRAGILKKALLTFKQNLITEHGFSSVIELLIKLNKIGATFTEVPATIDWKNKKGASKMKIGETVLRHFNLYKNYLLGKFS